MAKHKVEITGLNTSEIEVLSSEEMDKLFKQMNEGDKSARDKLINGNLKLVLSILKKYKERGNLDDLFQIGCVGLIKAVDNFDFSYGVKFSTYAVLMIDGEIRRYLRDNRMLRVSRSIKDLAYRKLKLESEEGKLSIDELSKRLNATPYEISLAESSFKEPLSIYKPIYENGGETIYLFDELSDEKDSSELNTHIALYDAINKLKDKERFILEERYVKGRTQTEVGNDLLISQAQISRIEKGAVKKLKKTLKF